MPCGVFARSRDKKFFALGFKALCDGTGQFGRFLWQRSIFPASCRSARLLWSAQTTMQGDGDVDYVLRLDVLAVCAVFAFVGAILLGAF